MPSASFRFGTENQHELRMECSYFGGERYFVNDKLLHSYWGLHPRITREFQAEGHAVRIDLNANLKRIEVNGFIDGELVAPDLYADLNRQFTQRRKPQNIFITFVIWVVIGIATVTLLRIFNVAT